MSETRMTVAELLAAAQTLAIENTSLREQVRVLREALDDHMDLVRFLTRPDFDWVEDTSTAQDMAARLRALTATDQPKGGAA